jgi:hypothetical protein
MSKFADTKPWETTTRSGRADLRLHPLIREAYKVACLIEDCGCSPALTTASSAAFSLADQLTEFFREHPEEVDPLCTCGHYMSDHPHDHACMRSECACHAFVDQRG